MSIHGIVPVGKLIKCLTSSAPSTQVAKCISLPSEVQLTIITLFYHHNPYVTNLCFILYRKIVFIWRTNPSRNLQSSAYALVSFWRRHLFWYSILHTETSFNYSIKHCCIALSNERITPTKYMCSQTKFKRTLFLRGFTWKEIKLSVHLISYNITFSFIFF